MRGRKGRLAKLLSLPVLAVCGFAVAATMAGVGLASELSSTTSTTTPPTTTTPPPTTTTTTTTTTMPPGNEGCTPGFWKNHPDVWPAPYTPSTLVEDVFVVPDEFAGLTLQQGLELGGGGENALLRHGIAALLNAASDDVDYPLTVDEVIAAVNAAFAGDEDVEAVKDMLEGFNELTAPGFCD
jgi:hypothetical protein